MAVTDGPQDVNSDVVFFTGSGTLDSSNLVQINFDTVVFAGQEGKQRLLASLELMVSRIETARLWPVTSAS
jgi:hypothetical protein